MAINSFPPASSGGGTSYTFTNPTETLTLTPGTYRVKPWVAGTNSNLVTRVNIECNGVDVSKTDGVFRTDDGSVTAAMQLDLPWRARSSGTSTDWNGCAYGNGIYVIAGNSGNLRTSTNTITWTSRTSTFGTSAIRDVKFGGGVFVAAGDDGKIATSTDGITWTSRTSPTASAIGHLAYGNGTWLYCGNNNNIYGYSTDNGVNWTNDTGSTSTNNNGLAYGDGIFVIVGNVSAQPYLFWSTTGTGGWTTVDSWAETTPPRSVGYINGCWFVGQDSSRSTMSGSPPMALVRTGWPDTVNRDFGTHISVFNGKLVGGRSYHEETTDGINWKPSSRGARFTNDITYGNGVALAVGSSNTVTSTLPYSTVDYGATFELIGS